MEILGQFSAEIDKRQLSGVGLKDGSNLPSLIA